MNGKNHKPHRISLELKLGRPIADGLQALHRCKKNRKCLNPEHLYEGTPQENMEDRMRDGNTAKGEKQGSSTLNADKVRLIRILYASGHKMSHRKLGAVFGVSGVMIGDIVNMKNWSHIT